jgi:hypothetical protein
VVAGKEAILPALQCETPTGKGWPGADADPAVGARTLPAPR